MIEDLFFKRYDGPLFHSHQVHPNLSRVLVRAALIFFDDVNNRINLDDSFFLTVERQLTRELGSDPFPNYTSPYNRCKEFLTETYVRGAIATAALTIM